MTPSVPSLTRELAVLTESGLITAEAHQQLSLAVAALVPLKSASTPPGERHFARIDAMLTAKAPTPAGQARACLHALDRAWAPVQGDFHRYREMHAQIKLRRAKLAKRRKEAPEDEDDKAIVEAECYLEQTQIDGLESELAIGEGKLRRALAQTTVHSQQYKLICAAAGKESFTEDDFTREEAVYLIKSAWWHAVQVFLAVDLRNTAQRTKEDKSEKAAEKRRAATIIETPEEVVLYFKNIGIDESTIMAELRDIHSQKEMHDRHHEMQDEGRKQPFRPYFEAWLDRMVVKYAASVTTLIKNKGLERMRETDSLITPTDKNEGTGDTIRIPRGDITK